MTSVFHFNNSPIANAMKIPLGYDILKSCSPYGHWNFSVFLISLKYMATMKFYRAIDLQIWLTQMSDLENN